MLRITPAWRLLSSTVHKTSAQFQCRCYRPSRPKWWTSITNATLAVTIWGEIGRLSLTRVFLADRCNAMLRSTIAQTSEWRLTPNWQWQWSHKSTKLLARGTCLYHLHLLSQLKRQINPDVLKQLVLDLILARLDFGNALLVGLPWSTIAPLQLVQNAAARLVVVLPDRADLCSCPRCTGSTTFVDSHVQN